MWTMILSLEPFVDELRPAFTVTVHRDRVSVRELPAIRSGSDPGAAFLLLVRRKGPYGQAPHPTLSRL